MSDKAIRTILRAQELKDLPMGLTTWMSTQTLMAKILKAELLVEKRARPLARPMRPLVML